MMSVDCRGRAPKRSSSGSIDDAFEVGVLRGLASSTVMTSPELLTVIAGYDDGPLSFLRYREVCRGWRNLSRSEALLKCLTSAEACLAYKLGASYRVYSSAWGRGRSFLVRRRAGSVGREVGPPVSVGRHRFFFEWLERDSDSIAIWDLIDWWRLTVSRTAPSANHVSSGGATCARGELVYLCGGSAAGGATLDSIFLLDTKRLDRGWQLSVARLPVPTSDAACEVVGGELVVVGGCARQADGTSHPVCYVQFVDLATAATRLVDLPEDYHRCCAASCSLGTSIFLAGGGPASRWEALQQQQQQQTTARTAAAAAAAAHHPPAAANDGEPPPPPPHHGPPNAVARDAADRRSPCQAVLSYDLGTNTWKALNFPLVIRDKPSVVAFPDRSILVAGTIAKALDARLAGAFDVDDCAPQPPMRFDLHTQTWAPFTALDPRTRHSTPQRVTFSRPRPPRAGGLNLSWPSKPDAPADTVVSDLSVLDLAVVYEHLFQPKLTPDALLPRDQQPPALLDDFAQGTPQSGKLWWYAERSGR